MWGNPSFPHFRPIPDLQLWARYNIKLLKDVVVAGSLRSFQELVRVNGLPRWMLFRYHQLRHAFRAQFPTPPDLTSDAVKELLAQETLPKPLSALNFNLIRKDSLKMDVLWSRWGADIPTLDRESYEESFAESFKLVISSRDKLIQAKFFHRTYLTPQRLHRIYPERSPECPRCRSLDSSYIDWGMVLPQTTGLQ